MAREDAGTDEPEFNYYGDESNTPAGYDVGEGAVDDEESDYLESDYEESEDEESEDEAYDEGTSNEGSDDDEGSDEDDPDTTESTESITDDVRLELSKDCLIQGKYEVALRHLANVEPDFVEQNMPKFCELASLAMLGIGSSKHALTWARMGLAVKNNSSLLREIVYSAEIFGADDLQLEADDHQLEVDPRLTILCKLYGSTLPARQAAVALEDKKWSLAIEELSRDPSVPAQYCAAVLYDKIDQKEKVSSLLRSLIASHPNFAASYYGLATCLRRQGAADEALALVRRGREVLELSTEDCGEWPRCLAAHFPESDTDALRKLLNDEFATMQRNPEATCRHEDCLHLHPNGPPPHRRTIYADDPGFKGFCAVACSEHCHIQFHPVCWRELREQHHYQDKCFLLKRCFTPDCEGVIVKVSVRRENGETKDHVASVPVASLVASKVKSEPCQTNSESAKNCRRSKLESAFEAARISAGQVRKLSKPEVLSDDVGGKSIPKEDEVSNRTRNASSRSDHATPVEGACGVTGAIPNTRKAELPVFVDDVCVPSEILPSSVRAVLSHSASTIHEDFIKMAVEAEKLREELTRVTKELTDEKGLTYRLFQHVNQLNSIEEQRTHNRCDRATDTADLGFSQYGDDVERFHSPTFHEDFEELRVASARSPAPTESAPPPPAGAASLALQTSDQVQLLYGMLPRDELLLNAIRLRQNKNKRPAAAAVAPPVTPPVAPPPGKSAPPPKSNDRMLQQMLALRRGEQRVERQPERNAAVEVSQPDCAICIEALYNGYSEVMVLDPCQHVFHSLCIRKWLEEKRECPFCRNHIVLEEDFPALT